MLASQLFLLSLAVAAEASSAKRQGLPPVDSAALQASITEAALSQKAQQLEDAAYSTPDRNRVITSPGHENTLNLISGYLDTVADYYTYVRQPFTALYAQANGSFTVDGVDFEPSIFQYTPSGSVTAQIVPIANLGCNSSDFPAEVADNIALISRGTCEFGLKSALAGAAGATGAIIYNNAPGAFLAGTLGPPPRPEGEYVPTVGVTQENGTAILDAINSGLEVEGFIDVDSIVENRTTYNIIAETIGGDHDSVLVLGGHTDSVFAGPGINDDGSGTIGILETAIQLSQYSTNNAVRFTFWAGEEEGLLGSSFYASNLTAEEAAKIRLYLNFDMIASPNFYYALYDGDGSAFNLTGPPGSAEVEAFFADYFAQQGIPTAETQFDGRSDYQGFSDLGIPVGGIFTGAEDIKTEEEAELFGGEAGVAYDVNYHGAGDNYANLNFTAFVVDTKAIAASVAYYGTSFDSLPPKNSTLGLRRRNVKRDASSTCGTKLRLACGLCRRWVFGQTK